MLIPFYPLWKIGIFFQFLNNTFAECTDKCVVSFIFLFFLSLPIQNAVNGNAHPMAHISRCMSKQKALERANAGQPPIFFIPYQAHPAMSTLKVGRKI